MISQVRQHAVFAVKVRTEGTIHSYFISLTKQLLTFQPDLLKAVF